MSQKRGWCPGRGVYVVLCAVVVCLSRQPAQGDQAMCLIKQDAEWAASWLKPKMEIREFCAPCGDKQWSSKVVTKVDVVKGPGPACEYSVSVNGNPVDLAYVYVLDSAGWKNLAMKLRLTVEQVPEYLPAPGAAKTAAAEVKPQQKAPQKSRVPQLSTVRQIARLIPGIFAGGSAPYVIVDFGYEPEKQRTLLIVKGITEARSSSLRLFAGSIRQPPFSPVTVKGVVYSEETTDSRFKFIRRDGAWQLAGDQRPPASIPPRFWVIGTVKAGATVYKYFFDTPNLVAGDDGATVGVDVFVETEPSPSSPQQKSGSPR